MVAARRASDEQLVALCADPGRLCSLRVRCNQGTAVPGPAQLPTAWFPAHTAQPELRRPLLRLWGLWLHGQLGYGLWRGAVPLGSVREPGPQYPLPYSQDFAPSRCLHFAPGVWLSIPSRSSPCPRSLSPLLSPPSNPGVHSQPLLTRTQGFRPQSLLPRTQESRRSGPSLDPGPTFLSTRLGPYPFGEAASLEQERLAQMSQSSLHPDSRAHSPYTLTVNS